MRASRDEPFFVHLSRELDDLPEWSAPDGNVVRALGERDVAGRVEAHRSRRA